MTLRPRRAGVVTFTHFYPSPQVDFGYDASDYI